MKFPRRLLLNVRTRSYEALLLLAAYVVAPAVRRRRRALPIRTGSTILLPPEAPGGYGDEAVMAGALVAIQQLYGTVSVTIIERAAAGEAAQWRGAGHAVALDASRWFRRRSPRLLGAFARAALRHDRFVVLGTDTLDGYYNSQHARSAVLLLKVGARFGLDTRVVGISFSPRATNAAIKEIRSIPKSTQVFARDAASQVRLQQLIPHVVERCFDSAFLMPPDRWKHEADDFRFGTDQTDYIVGLNLSPSICKWYPGLTPDVLVHSAAQLVRLSEGIHWVLIPHDTRGATNDGSLLHDLHSLLRHEKINRTSIAGIESAQAAKRLCTYLDLVLTSRMHLAIAAVGVGTPVLCVSYQGKVDGLLLEIDLPEHALDPSILMKPQELSERVAAALTRRSSDTRILSHHLENLTSGALAGFR